jgi:glycosyltransferase involved in cell wall biosynthesis
VSVVIPTRNRWPFLRRALASVLAQEAVGLEVIVVDDGSTDDTPERLAEVDDGRLTVVRRETGGRVASARNAGLAQTRGEWVAFLDDDDVWAPTKLRVQLGTAAAAGADWVYAAVVVVDEELNVLIPAEPPIPAERIAAELRTHNAVPSGSNAAARRSALLALDGFDERLVLLDDWDMWLRLALSYPAAACPEVLVAYVRHRTSHQVMSANRVMADFRLLAAKHASGVRLDGVALSRWAAGGHRRAGELRAAAWLYLRSGLTLRSPGNVARAVGVLFGEGAMRRLGGRKAAVVGDDAPEWLARYR